uniref:hypothetical protein n=1 Tax=Variovorax sp. BK018 TaxID=3450241 RepID=UPI00403A04D0
MAQLERELRSPLECYLQGGAFRIGRGSISPDFTEGSPIQDRDIATQYLGNLLGVIGIEDATVVAGGRAKAVDLHEQTMDGFFAALQPRIDRAAQVEITRQF